mmetsp:Transcript_16421/g.44999  ORF Transcript_16421/g.44999 Transcript_16421/m.44999 type:complete len:249 (-) Transcript_16421:548-1294(-)
MFLLLAFGGSKPCPASDAGLICNDALSNTGGLKAGGTPMSEAEGDTLCDLAPLGGEGGEASPPQLGPVSTAGFIEADATRAGGGWKFPLGLPPVCFHMLSSPFAVGLVGTCSISAAIWARIFSISSSYPAASASIFPETFAVGPWGERRSLTFDSNAASLSFIFCVTITSPCDSSSTLAKPLSRAWRKASMLSVATRASDTACSALFTAESRPGPSCSSNCAMMVAAIAFCWMGPNAFCCAAGANSLI